MFRNKCFLNIVDPKKKKGYIYGINNCMEPGFPSGNIFVYSYNIILQLAWIENEIKEEFLKSFKADVYSIVCLSICLEFAWTAFT